MPNDISVTTTVWASVTLAQNERWQVILGQARISADASEPTSLLNGLLLKNFETVDLTSGTTVYYRKNGSAACTIARFKR